MIFNVDSGVNTMVISTTGILLYAKVYIPLLQKHLSCCLHVSYIVYKHLNIQVYIGPLKARFFRYIPTRVFEIQRSTCFNCGGTLLFKNM